MSKITEKKWLDDFHEFITAGDEGAPSLDPSLFSQVRSDLNPSPWLVFAKLLGIHSVVGTLSLAICDQFGITPFQTGFSLSDYVMKFGHSTCMVFCGFLFISLSVLLTVSIVGHDQLRILKKNAPLQVFGLSMISLGIFAALGAELTAAVALLWLFGALAGGLIITTLPRRLRLV